MKLWVEELRNLELQACGPWSIVVYDNQNKQLSRLLPKKVIGVRMLVKSATPSI